MIGLSRLLKSNTLGLIKRAFLKIVVYPYKYKNGNDYNASRYWHDRLTKFGQAYRGVGHEGLSEDDNQRMYEEAGEVFDLFSRKENIHYSSGSILEIGCGNGFFTQRIKNAGGKNYTGLDITDALFPQLKINFPDYIFIIKDIAADKLDNYYDIVVMIDVIEHIVSDSKLSFAMESIKKSLAENGVLIIAPIMKERKKSLFYVRFWALDEIKKHFPENDYSFGEAVPFRSGSIVSVRKKTGTQVAI